MKAELQTAVFNGLEAIPATMVVSTEKTGTGLKLDTAPLAANQETPHRILHAIQAAGLEVPTQRIRARLVNPHGVITEVHDLVIALGVLVVTGQLDAKQLNKTLTASAIGHGHRLEQVRGLYPIAQLASRSGQKLLSNRYQKADANAAGKGKGLFSFDLADMVERLKRRKTAESLNGRLEEPRHAGLSVDEIRGNHRAKRALAIAAAGRHHIVLSGPPDLSIRGGLAKTVTRLMPEPDAKEAAELLTILSMAGMLNIRSAGWTGRACRFLHFTARSAAFKGSITGSDRTDRLAGRARPGEISLAHRGVLTIDDLASHQPESLDVIADAITDRVIKNEQASLPADFTLIVIAPGNFQTPKEAIESTIGRSHAVAGLMQIGAYVQNPDHEPIRAQADTVTGPQLRKQVAAAHATQRDRYPGAWMNGNAPKKLLQETALCTRAARERIAEIHHHDGDDTAMLILRIARTLADMKGQKMVTEELVDAALIPASGTGSGDF